MADQANVTSIDALDEFKSVLVLFVAKARRSLDDVGDEVRRTGQWLEHDRRVFWERESARRTKVVAQAQQDLMSARLSQLHDKIQVQQSIVLKAKNSLAQAETKRASVRTWTRNFESSASPRVKRLEGFRHLLDHDMPRAIAYLISARNALEEYSETAAPVTAPAPAPAPGQELPQ